MRKILLIGMVILASMTAACKGTGKNNDRSGENAQWKTLKQGGCEIQYPASLELNSQGAMGTSFVLFFDLDSPEDRFRENINLMIQDLKGLGVDLDAYVSISEEQVKTLITDGKIIESRRVEKNGSEFQKVIYTGKQGEFDLKFEQYYMVKGGKAYVLTFTAEADRFDSYKDTAEEIMDTFKIK